MSPPKLLFITLAICLLLLAAAFYIGHASRGRNHHLLPLTRQDAETGTSADAECHASHSVDTLPLYTVVGDAPAPAPAPAYEYSQAGGNAHGDGNGDGNAHGNAHGDAHGNNAHGHEAAGNESASAYASAYADDQVDAQHNLPNRFDQDAAPPAYTFDAGGPLGEGEGGGGGSEGVGVGVGIGIGVPAAVHLPA